MQNISHAIFIKNQKKHLVDLTQIAQLLFSLHSDFKKSLLGNFLILKKTQPQCLKVHDSFEVLDCNLWTVYSQVSHFHTPAFALEMPNENKWNIYMEMDMFL